LYTNLVGGSITGAAEAAMKIGAGFGSLNDLLIFDELLGFPLLKLH
jgi:hypothetical protein